MHKIFIQNDLLKINRFILDDTIKKKKEIFLYSEVVLSKSVAGFSVANYSLFYQ